MSKYIRLPEFKEEREEKSKKDKGEMVAQRI